MRWKQGSPIFRCRDHRDTKLEIELRMSSNEKEEEEERKKKLDGTRVLLGCEMRCSAETSGFDHRETVDCIPKQTEKHTL